MALNDAHYYQRRLERKTILFFISETRIGFIRTQTEPALKVPISLRYEGGDSKAVQNVGNRSPQLHGANAWKCCEYGLLY